MEVSQQKKHPNLTMFTIEPMVLGIPYFRKPPKKKSKTTCRRGAVTIDLSVCRIHHLIAEGGQGQCPARLTMVDD